ncbi:hypothetical protein [Henriciella aquimarina]|uniref:hypothetical protein n=1 Tax=Henriciella aquimarina TaxID=545261 RepID=UPI0009FDF2D6|nr:hypothetical protein [Henriciella aquimarina]
MQYQNGSRLRDKAAESGAPQTRAEVDSMIAQANKSDILVFVQRWLGLDDELLQLSQQADHVETVLGDKLLGGMLKQRAQDVIFTMQRRARDLARLVAQQPEDIGAKCYVRARLLEISPDDAETPEKLCEGILKDVERLGIDVPGLRRPSH